MSTMAISPKALASVRETLCVSVYWRQMDKDTPFGLQFAFSGSYHMTEDEMRKLADEFVFMAHVFNETEYCKGQQAKGNYYPVEFGLWKRMTENMNARRLSSVQLYKTLQMIDYNTDAIGWLTEEERQNWCMKDEFAKFKETTRRMIACLSAHIISFLDEYKEAKWSIE